MSEAARPEDRHAAMRAAYESEIVQAGDRLLRAVLEAVCQRDGLSLESSVTPGEPARNYELAERLRIGHVFGLKGHT